METVTTNGRWGPVGTNFADESSSSESINDSNVEKTPTFPHVTSGTSLSPHTSDPYSKSDDEEDGDAHDADLANMEEITAKLRSMANQNIMPQQSLKHRKSAAAGRVANGIDASVLAYENDGEDYEDTDGYPVLNGFRSKPVVTIQKHPQGLSKSRVHFFMDMGYICQCFFLVVCGFFILNIIVVAMLGDSKTNWTPWNSDTLTTTFSNLMVAPRAEHVFKNSEEDAGHYVRYGRFVELITSSFDFSFDTKSRFLSKNPAIDAMQHDMAKDKNATKKRDAGSDGHTDGGGGEESYVAWYHRHLSEEPNVPNGHINLASINTISKIRLAQQHDHGSGLPEYGSAAPPEPSALPVYGKISMATYDADKSTMHEVMTLDASSVHILSNNTFVANSLFVENRLYMGIISSDGYAHGDKKRRAGDHRHTVYTPMIDVEYRDAATYNNDGKPPVLTATIGNKDIHKIDVRASEYICMDVAKEPVFSADKYTTAISNALEVPGPVLKRYTDATTVVANSAVLANDTEALEKVLQLPVRKFTSKITNHEHVMLLAQEVESILPHVVIKGNHDKTKKTVDTDAVIAQLVLAIQAQQKIIDELLKNH